MYGLHGIPQEAYYLYRQGIELFSREDYTAAARFLRQAVTISPQFTEANRVLGSCLAKIEQH
jgi:Flp pilus assembly protein TadD